MSPSTRFQSSTVTQSSSDTPLSTDKITVTKNHQSLVEWSRSKDHNWAEFHQLVSDATPLCIAGSSSPLYKCVGDVAMDIKQGYSGHGPGKGERLPENIDEIIDRLFFGWTTLANPNSTTNTNTNTNTNRDDDDDDYDESHSKQLEWGDTMFNGFIRDTLPTKTKEKIKTQIELLVENDNKSWKRLMASSDKSSCILKDWLGIKTADLDLPRRKGSLGLSKRGTGCINIYNSLKGHPDNGKSCSGKGDDEGRDHGSLSVIGSFNDLKTFRSTEFAGGHHHSNQEKASALAQGKALREHWELRHQTKPTVQVSYTGSDWEREWED
ncbi:uncharacterized protein IL334_000123 [Kwoniella shivajii]|uniref:Uncharacterized protein n=1 Tax=Kwoniella shivajii TaxID=564305 RepID=A0ABZ1CN94_9TREE|nr:hypothetical protein IL334_000123 [Kwoniella shivajii]